MSRYRGPRLKIINRLGNLPGLTNKSSKSKRIGSDQLLSRKISQFCIRLETKQKLRFNFGLTERQLLKYVRIAKRVRGSTGHISLQLVEMRLDNTLFRLGMSPSIPGARQLVNHRHILVNDRVVDIPSYSCRPNDVITIRDHRKSRDLLSKNMESSYENKIPNHLNLFCSEYDKQYMKGFVNRIIDRDAVNLEVNELLIVEYYSRKA